MSDPSSGRRTPPFSTNAAQSRFVSQQATAEDLLKSQTVGLVKLEDFRKRRAEALEQKDREAQGVLGSGASTPRDGALTPQPAKKKRKAVAKGKLSFGVDDEEDDGASSAVPSRKNTPKPPNSDVEQSKISEDGVSSRDATPASDADSVVVKKRLGANAKLGPAPKAMTKASLLRDAQTREQLRREFLTMQESVRATEIVIPFVFYDGSNIPGGSVRVKKGEQIWLFLDRARKIGAESGAGGSGDSGSRNRHGWARISVDDLMLVRGEIILPHHYEFYYFLINRTMTSRGLLFPHSSEPTSATPKADRSESSTPEPGISLITPGMKKTKQPPSVPDSALEGYDDDPALTKVVDRRWYERNKHIFPASTWEEFDPTRDYSNGTRKDQEGNAFFF